jgi:hypothetical protein
MDWRSQFNAAFFAAWQDACLPGSVGYASYYDEFRRSVKVPQTYLLVSQSSGPLAAVTLRDVYTFGVFIGHMIGRLLGIPAAEVDACAEWCGSFNLGISLFDYLSDEAGQAEDLSRSPQFARLASDLVPVSRREGATEPQSEVVQLLDDIAIDVMGRLEALVGPLDRQPSADGMWTAFSEMIRAELLISQARLAANPDVVRLLHATKKKSSGPFCCMAEWMSLCSGRDYGGVSRASARILGDALGECFWLVDDAKDLWEDFDAGRWNLFLLTAAQTEPDLFTDPVDPWAEFRLSRILTSRGWAKRIISPVVTRVRDILRSAPVATTERDEIAGLLAVSIDRWLRY